MTDETRGNIKVDRETYERHNERRRELGLTWAEYLDGETPELDVDTLDADEVREIVREEVRNAMQDLVR